ncbi:MAG: DUF2703 domain-containing protein, partial [Candidatus Dadabacteria bacterium]|nr:DUF2703 domain-containing protein [Candidatus Dadabacteria bacterium]
FHIDTEQKALDYGLEVSPTIRINGIDIQSAWTENKCSDCGDLCECAGDISCRIWNWNSKQYSSAPEALIIEAILNNIYSDQNSHFYHEHGTVKLNTNIKTFFAEKKTSADKYKCSCC